MPSYQGTFDGLCGMYAIVNAYETCGIAEEKDLEILFKLACEALPRQSWPQVLWKGTSFLQMRTMIRRCEEAMASGGVSPIKSGFPFSRNTPVSDDEHWARFDEVFSETEVMCGIVGVEKPSPHWIVIERESKNRVWFTDSDGDKDTEYRKNIASLYAGERRRLRNQWLLNRKQLIVFKMQQQ